MDLLLRSMERRRLRAYLGPPWHGSEVAPLETFAMNVRDQYRSISDAARMATWRPLGMREHVAGSDVTARAADIATLAELVDLWCGDPCRTSPMGRTAIRASCFQRRRQKVESFS
jgi:hypothetical protein